MSVRLRLALTVLLTGLATALGVLVATALAFERFEREATYGRADAFLGRVLALHDNLAEQQQRDSQGFVIFLRGLLLLEPASQLYLLAPDGTVLASSGEKRLPPGFKVAIGPVREAAAHAAQPQASPAAAAPSAAATAPATATPAATAATAATASRRNAYVMGDDPEYMDHDAVVAARALVRPTIRQGGEMAGYLYIVCRKPGLPPSRLARLAEHLAGPALWPVLAVVLLATLLAAWIIAAVTRPLAVLSTEVAAAARAGLDGQPAALTGTEALARRHDEFARLHRAFQMLLSKLRAQWSQLQRLDAFRRESVSNLSHDLRSPLTAAAASLETLQRRWHAAGQAHSEEMRLVEVALRNTHNAARLVRSLGDLAVLDEAGFKLRLARLDLAEVLDDIAMRFAERAARQGVTLACELDEAEPLAAVVDIELIERAVANLLDNALRHTPQGGRIVLAAHRVAGTGAMATNDASDAAATTDATDATDATDPTDAPAAPATTTAPHADGTGAPALRPGAASGAAVRLTVRDNGSGIAPEDLAHLFDRHFSGRARAPTRGPEGAPPATPGSDTVTGGRADGGKGLGLAIVQRIVELHGGTVAVQSQLGHGTEVALELPPSALAAPG